MADLTVLGAVSGAPVAESGCSAYLVSYGGETILLDCGPGSLGRLRAETSVHALRAVVITHMHADHFLDLIPLNTALWTEPPPGGAAGARRRLPVFLPPGGLETLAATFNALTINVARTLAGRYAEALDCREYAPGETLALGALSVTIVGPLRHATPDYGLRVAAGDGVLAYTGDTAPCAAAVDLARGASLLLAECTYPEPGESPEALHTSARELGEIALQAGCRRLVATHFALGHWPAGRSEREAAIMSRIRAGGYQGELSVAAPGARYAF